MDEKKYQKQCKKYNKIVNMEYSFITTGIISVILGVIITFLYVRITDFFHSYSNIDDNIITPFGACAIGIAFVALSILFFFRKPIANIRYRKMLTESNRRAYNRKHNSQLIKFYEECMSSGIIDLTTNAQKEKALLILKKYDTLKASTAEDIEALLLDGFNIILNEKREKEKAEYKKLTKHIELYGREKRKQMLAIERDKLRNEQKETSKRNDEALWDGPDSSEYRRACRFSDSLQYQSYTERINEKQAQINATDTKMVITDEQNLIENISFSSISVDISDTGAFKVSVYAEHGKKEYQGINCVLDGSINAVLYQNGIAVGKAPMVLPLWGLENAYLHGICLSGAIKNIPYEVKFEENKLWCIEP